MVDPLSLITGHQLTWAILLLLAGLFLILAEVFIPSGGILGLLSAAALVGSLWFAYEEGWGAFTIFFSMELLVVPIAIAFGFHVLPKTPLGRRMILSGPTPEQVAPRSERDQQQQSLLGQVGRTLTSLRPSGLTEFDGRRVDTISEGVIIEPDTLVRVIDVEGYRVVVREINSEELPA